MDCAGDTIAAVATPPGAGTWAVLRLSGPAAFTAVESLLGKGGLPLGGKEGGRHCPGEGGLPGPGGEARGEAPGEGPRKGPRKGPCEALDSLTGGRFIALSIPRGRARIPGRAAVFRAPRSYTRQDLVELTVPGSPPLVARLLADLLGQEGVRLARPGEFTLRAFLGGRIDLSQAEAVASLIQASSLAEERAAQRQLSGELRARVEGLAAALLECLALLEAALDFPDEDLPQVSPAALRQRLEVVLASIHELRSASSLRLPDTGALRAVLAGFPNAGKSSLLNALLGRPAAIVADVSGTTRDPVRGSAKSPGGRTIDWVDVAGFEAPPAVPAGAVPAEAAAGGEGLEAAVGRLTRRELEEADLMVWVHDATAHPGRAERSLEVYRALAATRKLLVVSKADRLAGSEAAGWQAHALRPVVTSAVSGRGIEELRRRAAGEGAAREGALGEGALGGEPAGQGEGGSRREAPQFLLTARQEGALERARLGAARARNALERGEGYELVAVDLREAHGALHEITGRELGEAVLEGIFTRFCIGK